MADEGIAWMYLVFFLIIPLSRIVPRLIRKWRNKNLEESDQYTQTFSSTNETITESPQRNRQEDIPSKMKPQSVEMLVLGELNRGTKSFDSIQKNLGIDSKILDSTLQNLEDKGLMKVQNKQGLFGPKIELLITDEGFKKFYS